MDENILAILGRVWTVMKDRIAVALPSIENPSKRIKVWVASRGCFDRFGSSSSSSSSSIGAGGAREKIDDEEWHDDDKTDKWRQQQLEKQR